jgi:hypothetical protein
MQMQIEEQIESNAYSLFVYALRSQVTRDHYLRRLKIFFNFIDLLPNENIESRRNQFAFNGTKDSKWAFNCIIRFLQFQKDRAEEMKNNQ